MTTTQISKRVIFYLTIIAIVLTPFVLEGGITECIIRHFSALALFVSLTVAAFWKCTKEEFTKVTGLRVFDEI